MAHCKADARLLTQLTYSRPASQWRGWYLDAPTIEEFSSGVELDNLLMEPLLAAGSSQRSTAVESNVHNA